MSGITLNSAHRDGLLTQSGQEERKARIGKLIGMVGCITAIIAVVAIPLILRFGFQIKVPSDAVLVLGFSVFPIAGGGIVWLSLEPGLWEEIPEDKLSDWVKKASSN